MGYKVSINTEKPLILYPETFNLGDFNNFLKNIKVWKKIDIYAQQLEEYYEIKHPNKIKSFDEFKKDYRTGDLAGAWVYYPWSGELIHVLDANKLDELRTNRNQELISSGEQNILRNSKLGVAGMSVGSGIVLSCIYSGISNDIKIADFDNLSTTNLNRLKEKLSHIGSSKAMLTARQIYELNPFAEIDIFQDINSGNINEFFNDPKIDLVVDEIDDFKMKVQLRIKAKNFGIPLLMFTSLGDNILIDIERYDTDRNLPIFNGAIGKEAENILSKDKITEEDLKRYAVSIVGPNYVPTLALKSLLNIGTSLVGRPQLYSTIAVDGGLAAYIIRQILLKKEVLSGRYFVKFAELVNIKSDELNETSERKDILDKLMNR